MNLQQFIVSFVGPLASEAVESFIRLLDIRNKTARGLKDSINPNDVVRRPL